MVYFVLSLSANQYFKYTTKVYYAIGNVAATRRAAQHFSHRK